jgi:chromosome partitioning protein
LENEHRFLATHQRVMLGLYVHAGLGWRIRIATWAVMDKSYTANAPLIHAVYTTTAQRKLGGRSMILAIGNIKGGVGKSTLTANIAVALALVHGGTGVLVIDGDDQASAATFAALRAELELPEGVRFTTVQLQGAAIRQQARQLSSKYGEIIIDVGGRDTGSLRAALTVADALLIPFQPRSVDLWVADQIASLVREAREVNENLKAYALLNIADAQGKDNDDASAALSALDGVELLPWVVGRRKAFPNAFSAGLSVLEQSPRDHKACSELTCVVNALYIHRRDNDYQRAQAG